MEKEVRILRHRQTDNFTTLPNALICDKKISWKGLGLLVYLLHLPPDWLLNLSHLSTRRGGHGSKFSATRAGISELQDAGYLRIERVREKGRFGGVVWLVSDTPEFGKKAEKPTTERDPPQVDFPLADFPAAENPQLIKNNFKKNFKTTQKREPPRSDPTTGVLIINKDDESLLARLKKIHGVGKVKAVADQIAQPWTSIVAKKIDLNKKIGDKLTQGKWGGFEGKNYREGTKPDGSF